MSVTIRITRRGVYRGAEMVPVGTELTLDQEPTAWANKYEVVGNTSAEAKTLEVATPTPTAEPQPEDQERPKRRGRPRRQEYEE